MPYTRPEAVATLAARRKTGALYMSLAARRKTWKSEALYMFSEYSKEQKCIKLRDFHILNYLNVSLLWVKLLKD